MLTLRADASLGAFVAEVGVALAKACDVVGFGELQVLRIADDSTAASRAANRVEPE